jgi:hypothetical protein
VLIHVQFRDSLINGISFYLEPLNIAILKNFFLTLADCVESDEDLDQVHARDNDDLDHFSPLEDRKGSVDIIQQICVRVM